MGPVEFWHWWVLGGALFILETFAPGFVFLWLGLAAGAVGLILGAWPGFPLELQLLAFAGMSVASVYGWRRWLGIRPGRSDQPNLNRRAAQHVGRRFALIEPIANGRGRIRVADASWSVTGPDLPAGATVEVIGADGAVLQVRPVAEDRDPSPPEIAMPGQPDLAGPASFGD